MRFRRLIVLAAILLAAATPTVSTAGETQRLYLSGSGPNDTVTWDFRISEGRRAGEWASIEVPSQWEQQGFGTYAYGWEDDKPAEVGEYRYRFIAPADVATKRVQLVFEGAMTDTEVRLNGELAGDLHQGGFTRFSYSVDELLRSGESNLLEVKVAKESSNRSVNEAERDADYWVFGGIFRPVYLDVRPPSSIRRVAIAADHSGELELAIELLGDRGQRLEIEIRDPSSGSIVDSTSVPVAGDRVELRRRVESIRAWSAEFPQLYEMDLALLDRDGAVLHRQVERFGFRSVEVRPGEGLFVNDRRVLLKGINRHSFWPSTGRTLSREQNETDARLIKEMNMNAVRTSHYPPDTAFLEACDRIGLYVLDELPGWHDAYDTKVGIKLVREMVERDHNHPSIIAWNNGNEGGWNTALDRHFSSHDLQNRPVLHPDEIAGGLDTEHYPSYAELRARLEPSWSRRLLPGLPPPVMPTETLHGLYDGGMGSGLEDYWDLIRTSALGAGLFLWTFVDEGVVRTDRDGRLDTFYNLAPDGIVGPYREKEASFYSVREIWSPVKLSVEGLSHRSSPLLRVENRFDMTNLRDCTFEWAWLRLPQPGEEDAELRVVEEGTVPGPNVEPGEVGELDLGAGRPRARVDALRVKAFGPDGREIHLRVWHLRGPQGFSRRALEREPAGVGEPSSRRAQRRIELESGDVRVVFDAETGWLESIETGSKRGSLKGGPRIFGHEGVPKASEVSIWNERGSATALFRFESSFDYVRWRLDSRGWLHLRYQFHSSAAAEAEGVLFDLAADSVKSVRFLAAGPHRSWRNRTAGTRLGVWNRERQAKPPWESWDYPVLEGFYAHPYWAVVSSAEGSLTLLFESDDEVFLSLLKPRFPSGDSIDERSLARFTAAPVPLLDLGLLHTIPAVGTKFHRFDELGPRSTDRGEPGMRRGAVAFRFEPRR